MFNKLLGSMQYQNVHVVTDVVVIYRIHKTILIL